MRRTKQGVRLHSGGFAQAATKLMGAEAFVLGRRIFLSRSAAAAFSADAPAAREMLEHELVHVEQFRRLGVLPFLTRYLAEYVRFRLRGESHADAYHSISFEREAEERASRPGIDDRFGEQSAGFPTTQSISRSRDHPITRSPDG